MTELTLFTFWEDIYFLYFVFVFFKCFNTNLGESRNNGVFGFEKIAYNVPVSVYEIIYLLEVQSVRFPFHSHTVDGEAHD